VTKVLISKKDWTLRKEHWADSIVEAIDREVFAISCKYFTDAQPLGYTKQRCVSEVHWPIGILVHEFPHPGNVRRVIATGRLIHPGVRKNAA
jgi:hypothetical protein